MKTVAHAIAALLLGGISSSAIAADTATTTTPPAPAELRLRPSFGAINPFFRDINAFWGQINPFYGNVSSFWGAINPFYGNIHGFWGTVTPFYGSINSFYGNVSSFAGDVTAHYGNINTFWGNIGPFWGNVDAFWGNITTFNTAQLGELGAKVDDFVARAEAFWGAAVTAKTGLSFRDGFAKPIFAKYGMDLSDPNSFYGKTSAQRAEFMLAWYDQLMEFSGVDHVDHWMKTINWTPAITQQQGEGYDAIIGLVDFTVAGDADIQSKLSYFNGVSTFSNGHGAGVASLMVAAHDGRGVMGIAPHASVLAYNPFDASGTTSFGDIKNGIIALSGRGAGIINMSLGVPGWTLHPDWKGVFSDPTVATMRKNTIFVVAAGNDGKAQTSNIAWDYATDPNLLVVGSVAPDGTISSFSNTPGTACLLKADGKCENKNLLMNRFLVAPGELILVSDDHGGVVRQSGTSLAAPLVSGTIALLQDRWPWLVNYPKATMDIILSSAKDLGAPGVDPVYGWGLLDVAGAQSVLDFDKLKYYQKTDASSASLTGIKAISGSDVLKAGVNSAWEAQGAYFIVFEPTTHTQRDFAIPLSTRLYGQSLGGNAFQQFVYERLIQWLNTGKTDPKGFTDPAAHLNLSATSVTMPALKGYTLSFGYSDRQVGGLFGMSESAYAMRFAAEDGRFGVNLGYGDGAAVLGYQSAFALSSDYGAGSGVNPLLGFASGGAYGSVDVRLGDGFRLNAGISTSGDPLNAEGYGRNSDIPLTSQFERYSADALMLSLGYDVSETFGLRASFTQLSEEDGLLGVRSMQDDFSTSTVTDGMTLGADVKLDDGYLFGFSFTLGRTRRNENDLQVIEPVISSGFEFAFSKAGVFGEDDRARLTFGQPLTVESGALRYSQIGVVDRHTGELGLVTQDFGIAPAVRHYQAEFMYATPVLEGDGELGVFARSGFSDDGQRFGVEDYSAGVSFKLRF